MNRLNLQGAIDLSALAKPPASASTSGPVVEVSEANFQSEVLDRSQQLPVIVDLWATWCGPCKTLSPILEKLAAEYAGRLALVKIDVDANPRISQAFQVQSIPTVVAVVMGQVVPLFMGAIPEPQIRQYFDELLKIAEQQGMVDQSSDEVPTEVDPRFDQAVDAIEGGEWDVAEKLYREILASSPHDEDAKAGLAQVLLLRRADGIDPDDAMQEAMKNPADVALAIRAADALVLFGRTAEAFAMLITLVKSLSGPEREAVRKHVIELFDLVGNDPAVPNARIELANALF